MLVSVTLGDAGEVSVHTEHMGMTIHVASVVRFSNSFCSFLFFPFSVPWSAAGALFLKAVKEALTA